MAHIATNGINCFCTDTDKCVVDNRCGSKSQRCTVSEIKNAGHKTVFIGCFELTDGAVYTEVIRVKK